MFLSTGFYSLFWDEKFQEYYEPNLFAMLNFNTGWRLATKKEADR